MSAVTSVEKGCHGRLPLAAEVEWRPMSEVTLYHNPRCTKSRQALQIAEAAGDEFTVEVVKYLETPPAPDELRAIVASSRTIPLASSGTSDGTSSASRQPTSPPRTASSLC
jgi:hypothetical protein